LHKAPSILTLLRQRSRSVFGKRIKSVKDAREEMTQQSGPGGFSRSASSQNAGIAGDVANGSKRARLKGYLKAANELRQTYQQSYTSGWNNRESWVDNPEDGTASAYPDAAVVRSGDEEMILFPSYARKHYRVKVFKVIDRNISYKTDDITAPSAPRDNPRAARGWSRCSGFGR
jgi:hypothetical protein